MTDSRDLVRVEPMGGGRLRAKVYAGAVAFETFEDLLAALRDWAERLRLADPAANQTR